MERRLLDGRAAAADHPQRGHADVLGEIERDDEAPGGGGAEPRLELQRARRDPA
jgi:hypothetical protein